jgi:tripartite-type tricarboxylate transporter receptor subunit TctC
MTETYHRRSAMRKLILAAAAASTIATWATIACAQTYPSRTVNIVVPIAAGGAVDTTARIFAEQLQVKLGQPFVVENRTGAGATIGTSYVAKAIPDGYTLLLMESSAPLAKWLYKVPPFELKDFTPIAQVVSNPLVLFANPSFFAKDMKELIAYAKANPGKVSAGVSGMSHQLTSNMLNSAADIQITPVPYRGTAPAVNDILSGTIPLLWSTPVGLLQFVEQGKLKALAVSTAKRVDLLPNVPTLAETVAPGLRMDAWLGIAGPAGLPDEVSARLSQAIRDIAAMPEVRKRIADTGQNLEYLPAAQFRERLDSDQERLGAVIRDSGIQPN